MILKVFEEYWSGIMYNVPQYRFFVWLFYDYDMIYMIMGVIDLREEYHRSEVCFHHFKSGGKY